MPRAALRRLLVGRITGIHVVRLPGPRLVSEGEIGAALDGLSELREREGATVLVLNFADVHAMSSNLIAELVKFRRSLAATGGALKLCCLPAEVRPIFAWCRVAFAIYLDERDALDSS